MDIANNIKALQNQFSAGNYQEVIRGCKKILKIIPSNTYVLNLCGLSLQNIDDQESAIIFFKEAIKSDEKNFAAINNLANSYKARYEYDKAEELYLEIIKKNPDNLKALNNYANLKNKLSQFSEAIEIFLKASKIKHDEPNILFGLAASYQSIGDFKNSKKIIDKMLSVNPKNVSAHKMISAITKYTIENRENLDEMISISKDDSLKRDQKIDLFFALGKAYEDLKDYKESFKNLEIANSLKKEKFLYKTETDVNLFNSIIETFDKIDFSLFKKYSSEKEIIFICGMPRSGTTLVEQIIASHKEVSGAGELTYLQHVIENNFFKSSILDSKKILEKGLDEENILETEYMTLLNSHKFSSKKITDKAPHNFRWIGFIKIFFPNSKIIHCQRDPKDNCLSIFKNSFMPGDMAWSNSQEDIANYYNLYLNMMNFWQKKFQTFIYNVKYEDLVNKPEEEIKKLLKFCNLEWDSNCLNFHESKKTPIQTVSLVQARKPIYKSSVNSNIGYSQFLQKMNNILDTN